MGTEDRVIIAGAGPVGMVAAAYLGLNDIPVLVLEAGPDIATDLRASTFHPPTLDMLDFFDGLTQEMIDWGLLAPTWQYRDRETGPVVTWDMSLLKDDTNHPYRLQTEQWKLSRLLEKRVQAMPHVEIRYNHEVTAATQDGDYATLHFKTPDGEGAERGRWLIGCDGANSAVRRSNDIAYDGLTFPELFLTVSTTFRFEDHMPNLTYVNYVTDPDEWLVLLRVVDVWRVLFPTRPDEDKDEALSDDRLQARLQSVFQKDEPYDITHRTFYRVHQRVADSYRRGRIFLAGDSAHINNPLGGMGLNGGIQDAFNLCKRLVPVWRGEADESQFDGYEQQRRTMALDFVQRSTIANREMLRESDPAARLRKHDEMRAMAADPVRARDYLLRTSMITGLRETGEIQ